MERKLVIVVLALLAVVLQLQRVEAVFSYNRPLPTLDEVGEGKVFKCVPGRTVTKVKQLPVNNTKLDLDSDEYDEPLRTHMLTPAREDETCEVCICSVSGQMEYCSKRPAKNVNECLLVAKIMEDAEKGLPFDVESSLPYRVRKAGAVVPNTAKCLPFVSEYSDCTEENQCSGCTRCTCDTNGEWACAEVVECPSQGYPPVDEQSLDNTLQILYSELKPKAKPVEKYKLPEKVVVQKYKLPEKYKVEKYKVADNYKVPEKSNEDVLLGYVVAVS